MLNFINSLLKATVAFRVILRGWLCKPKIFTSVSKFERLGWLVWFIAGTDGSFSKFK